MENCIFCKIVKGDIKPYKVYEDKDCLAFLDINPATRGHTLIIPKKHYENIYDIPEKTLKSVIAAAKKISNEYKKKLNCKAINILHASGKEAQQSVFHFHIHIVPRYENDKIDSWPFKEIYKKESVEQIYKKIMK